ncbi:heme exporter protein CcmB [Ideonella livida]|uniref:Heme exporter protein B n=1 Tax=Ideonella livida TaxID=2707176 RepID=A0A7C9PGN7_9BURK|nr:heme exporter protein CcmB [Ideonella livida]NDY91477.1 heme exporter protein CcmB [Ideonella livida]
MRPTPPSTTRAAPPAVPVPAAPAHAADAAAPDWWRPLRAVAAREWAQAVQRPGDLAWHGGFFLMVAGLFPLAVRPDPATLAQLGPGVLWVGALLAVLLACGRLFHDDLRHGWLDQALLAGEATGLPLPLWVAARMAVQWVLAAGPVLGVAPVVALQFGLGGWALAVLALALALGTGVLVQVATVAAALSAGLRGAGLLTLLIVLPLAAPVLVFGSLAVQAAQAGRPVGAELSLLGALLALGTVVAPLLGALALRGAVEA